MPLDSVLCLYTELSGQSTLYWHIYVYIGLKRGARLYIVV